MNGYDRYKTRTDMDERDLWEMEAEELKRQQQDTPERNSGRCICSSDKESGRMTRITPRTREEIQAEQLVGENK